jgi:hypothetical protein
VAAIEYAVLTLKDHAGKHQEARSRARLHSSASADRRNGTACAKNSRSF